MIIFIKNYKRGNYIERSKSDDFELILRDGTLYNKLKRIFILL
jgi:hypothetical protein